MRDLLKKPPAFMAFLLLSCLVVFLGSVRRQGTLGPVPKGVLTILSLPQIVIADGIDGVRELWSDYLYLVGLTERYEALDLEARRLRAERVQLLELARENARLKKLLDFKEREAGTLLPARVVSEARGTTAVITIDRGSTDGVAPNLAVVSYEGLVGRTGQVTPLTSQVILLQDPRSRVPVRTMRSRARGIAAGRGQGELLSLDRVRRIEDIEPGDDLVTSGTGVVYPKGIPVGTITDVERNSYGLLQEAGIAPAVDFTRIEEVLVILPGAHPRSASLDAPAAFGTPAIEVSEDDTDHPATPEEAHEEVTR